MSLPEKLPEGQKPPGDMPPGGEAFSGPTVPGRPNIIRPRTPGTTGPGEGVPQVIRPQTSASRMPPWHPGRDAWIARVTAAAEANGDTVAFRPGSGEADGGSTTASELAATPAGRDSQFLRNRVVPGTVGPDGKPERTRKVTLSTGEEIDISVNVMFETPSEPDAGAGKAPKALRARVSPIDDDSEVRRRPRAMDIGDSDGIDVPIPDGELPEELRKEASQPEPAYSPFHPELDARFPISAINMHPNNVSSFISGEISPMAWVSMFRNSGTSMEGEMLMGGLVTDAMRAGQWVDMEKRQDDSEGPTVVPLADGGSLIVDAVPLEFERATGLLVERGYAEQVEVDGRTYLRPTEMLAHMVEQRIGFRRPEPTT